MQDISQFADRAPQARLFHALSSLEDSGYVTGIVRLKGFGKSVGAFTAYPDSIVQVLRELEEVLGAAWLGYRFCATASPLRDVVVFDIIQVDVD